MHLQGTRTIVEIGALALMALGSVVMVAWFLGWDVLTSVIPGFATMKPVTAGAFVLSGASLALGTRDPGDRVRVVSMALGGVVAVTGFASVAAYVLDSAWAISLPLLGANGADPPPMRMSAMTAVAFTLSGFGLVGVHTSAWRWTQGFALSVVAIAAVALAGYAYGVEALYSVGPFDSLALHTAVGFCVLPVAILFFRPEVGLVGLLRSRTRGAQVVRRYLPLLVAVPLGLGWLQLAAVRGSLFGYEFGMALLAVASALMLFGLIWAYAHGLDRAEWDRVELEKQVLRSQKMETAGRLAGGIAHDFNNVLTVVMTTARVVQSETDDEQAKADLDVILSAGEKAAELTKQLLALGRHQVLRPEVVSLNTVIGANSELIRRLVPEHITFTDRLADDLGNVLVDPGKVDQVVINLVVNAVDALPDGGSLTIETRNEELDTTYAAHHDGVDPGPHVVLVVSDDGVGMDEATMAHIFEPFFTTKGPGEGTGLGLATAYGIVRQSGGHIWVYSDIGVGTTFKVYLPCVDQPVAKAKRSPTPARRGKAQGTILVVDDDDAVRDLVAKVLRRHGYMVHVATNGADAIRVEESMPALDLVVSDVTMPEMGGRELRRLLGLKHPEVPFLFISGYAQDRAGPGAALHDADRILEKPFMPEVLLDRVGDLLARPVEGSGSGGVSAS